MVFSWTRKLFRTPPHKATAELLYSGIVTQARQPVLYRDFAVPDTVDGRFDMLAVHMFLVLDRLYDDAQAQPVTQALVNRIVADMDRSLREMGVGDLGVGKRVQKMAQALYGRLEAYSQGMASQDDDLLAQALERNVFRSEEPPRIEACKLAGYMRMQATALQQNATDNVLKGDLRFENEGEVA